MDKDSGSDSEGRGMNEMETLVKEAFERSGAVAGTGLPLSFDLEDERVVIRIGTGKGSPRMVAIVIGGEGHGILAPMCIEAGMAFAHLRDDDDGFVRFGTDLSRVESAATVLFGLMSGSISVMADIMDSRSW